MRLFVAVDVPGRVKESLREAMVPYRDRIAGARWTSPDSWHVTLKFLGWTWPRLVGEVQRAVGEAAAAGRPFETALTEVGAFPSPSRARVLWAGLADPEGRLAGLAGALDELLEAHVRPEKRAFSAHLTVARVDPPANLRTLPDLVGLPLGSDRFEIGELVLYRSHLSPRGARYEVIKSFDLSGA